MENNKFTLGRIGKEILKILLGVIILALVLAGLLLITIRMPAVQTWAVHKATTILSEKMGHEVTVGAVDIKFFKSILLSKVKVRDYKKEVLFSVDQIEADVIYFSPFKPDSLKIGTLTLTGPEANLIKYKGTDKFNLTSFLTAIDDLLKKKDTVSTKKPFIFSINAVAINNGRFTYDDRNKPRTKFGVDYQHMGLDSIYANFSDIKLGDTLGVNIAGLRTIDRPSNTRLHQLDTRMIFAPTFWEFANLNLRLGRSNLAKYIRFDYKKFGNFSYFNDSVTVTADLLKAKIYSDDVAQFAPQVKNIKENILLTGQVKGKVTRFNAKNLDARYGKFTHIVGNISANGLPNIKETFIELNLKPSVLNASDIKKYIPRKSYNIAQRLGTVKLNGNFTGFYNDFVANGSFATALGNIVSDINLKINENTRSSAYSGYLRTSNFQLGRLLGNTNVIQTVSIDGRIKGRGFDMASATVQLAATINAIKLYGYNYRNIKTDGTFSQEKFTGKLSINDPNVSLTAQGTINLSKTNPALDVVTQIENLNLKALGLTQENIQVKTDATLNFKGLTLDQIIGKGIFRNTALTLNQNIIPLDSVVLESGYTNGRRYLTFNSEVADISASGTWQYTTLIKDLSVLIEEYKLNFASNNAAMAAYYNRKPKYINKEYELEYSVTLKKFNPVIQAFVPELRVSPNTKLEGNFRQGANAIFLFHAEIDTLHYGKNTFLLNELELNTSKLPYSAAVLANASITSRKQKLTTGGQTENLYLEGVWSNKTILFTSNIAQVNTTNKASISGSLAFLQRKLQVVFNTSNINVLGKEWNITPNNTIEISGGGKEINFQDFVLSHQNQQISILGLLSQNPENELKVGVANFRLENLNSLMSQKIGGILNANLSLKNIFKESIITSTLTADSVMMDNYLIGTVAGSSNWDNIKRQLAVDLGVTRENMKVLNINGYYNPRSEQNQLDLLAIMDEAPVKLIEPLLKTLFGDLAGTMAGRLKITGRLQAPILAGSAMVTNGRFNFKYLNTVYTFSDRINFTENDITFPNIKLRDVLNNTATLSGSIIHQEWKDMILDLRGNFTKFMVLNTSRENNNLYYGTAIATGSATVLGSPSNLNINIDARSEAGTRISIPLNNNNTVTRQSFIKFVNRNVTDTSAMVVVENKVDLSGINLNFNLDVTPDAYLEIILDESTGDLVRGSGSGRIKMNIDTRGEFSMEGQVEIVRGAYNFNLYNVVNKEFLIRPGGTITWNGDPYAGIMKLTAAYTQSVTIPKSIIPTAENQNVPRIPVTAIMNLQGNLLTPEIILDLEFNNTPSDIEALLASYLADMRNDQDELNRQVFSLLILKRLSERNTLGSGSAALSQGIGGSLSEVITNQLSNWLSQVDSNLEVDIGVQGLNEEALNNLQLRLSYSLLQGKLRLTREGGINNFNNNTSTPGGGANNGNIAGDWRAEYYLGRSGKTRLRLEYNTTPTYFSSANNNTTNTRASILHTEQFDSFNQLFGRKRFPKRLPETPKIILDNDTKYDEIK